MEGRTLAEDRVEVGRVHRRDPRRIEVAEPALELGRSAECLLDGDLLVEREPDEQGQRILGEEAIGLGVAGERSVAGFVIARMKLGHRPMVVGRPLCIERPADG